MKKFNFNCFQCIYNFKEMKNTNMKADIETKITDYFKNDRFFTYIDGNLITNFETLIICIIMLL